MDAPKSDARIDGVKDRLSDDLVDERGNPADPSAVAKVVDEASAQFAEALSRRSRASRGDEVAGGASRQSQSARLNRL